MISKTKRRFYRISIIFTIIGICLVFAIPTVAILQGSTVDNSIHLICNFVLFFLLLALCFLLSDVIRISFFEYVPRHLYPNYFIIFGIYCIGFSIFSGSLFLLYDFTLFRYFQDQSPFVIGLSVIVIFLFTKGAMIGLITDNAEVETIIDADVEIINPPTKKHHTDKSSNNEYVFKIQE